MIDDQFSGKKRIDALGVAAHARKGFAHRGQIHHRGHAGEILQQDAGGHEGDFFFRGMRLPGCQRSDIRRMHEVSIFAAQQIFQQDAQGKGQLIQMPHAVCFQFFQPPNFKSLRADVERVTGPKRISRGDDHSSRPFRQFVPP